MWSGMLSPSDAASLACMAIGLWLVLGAMIKACRGLYSWLSSSRAGTSAPSLRSMQKIKRKLKKKAKSKTSEATKSVPANSASAAGSRRRSRKRIPPEGLPRPDPIIKSAEFKDKLLTGRAVSIEDIRLNTTVQQKVKGKSFRQLLTEDRNAGWTVASRGRKGSAGAVPPPTQDAPQKKKRLNRRRRAALRARMAASASVDDDDGAGSIIDMMTVLGNADAATAAAPPPPHTTLSKPKKSKPKPKKSSSAPAQTPKLEDSGACPFCKGDMTQPDRQPITCACGFRACVWCWLHTCAEQAGCPSCHLSAPSPQLPAFRRAHMAARTRVEAGVSVQTFDGKLSVSGLGEGDSWLLVGFLRREQADQALHQLLPSSDSCEVDYMQLYTNKASPLPRLMATQAEADKEGYTPIYRFPVNRQDRVPTSAFSPTCQRVRRRVERATAQLTNHLVVNLYRGRDDYIGLHTDKPLDIAKNSKIISVSLGAQRQMTLRSHCGRREQRVLLPHGSLLLLGPETNSQWHHSIPRAKGPVAPRVSLTFRRAATFVDEAGRIWGQGREYQTQNWPFFEHDSKAGNPKAAFTEKPLPPDSRGADGPLAKQVAVTPEAGAVRASCRAFRVKSRNGARGVWKDESRAWPRADGLVYAVAVGGVIETGQRAATGEGASVDWSDALDGVLESLRLRGAKNVLVVVGCERADKGKDSSHCSLKTLHFSVTGDALDTLRL